MKQYPTRALAEFVAGLTYEDLPNSARETLARCLLDAFGCAVAGLDERVSCLMADYVAQQAGPEQAVVWQNGRRVAAGYAAMANATAIHALLFDDTHPTKTHPGCVVIPAALAVGEYQGVNGKAWVTALAAGYEVMVRVAYGVDPVGARMRGWQLTPIVGTFGAAAAAGKLLGLSAQEMAWALGLAGTQSGGLYAFNADGSDGEKFHPGRAAQSGILAAELAARGLSGPTLILEADDGGFCRTFSDSPRLDLITDQLGERYRFENMLFKPYPSCASLVATVESAVRLHSQYGDLTPEIDEVRVHVAEVVERQCGAPGIPQGMIQAQLNLRHCVAVALQTGGLRTGDFTPERVRDPQVRSLADKVKIVVDPSLTACYPQHFGSRVEVRLKHGRYLQETVDDAPGSAQAPLTTDALMEKFELLVAPWLTETAKHSLKSAALAPERLDTVSEISTFFQGRHKV